MAELIEAVPRGNGAADDAESPLKRGLAGLNTHLGSSSSGRVIGGIKRACK